MAMLPFATNQCSRPGVVAGWRRALTGLSALALLGLTAAGAEAQERARVTGQVMHAETGAPLAQVQVSLDGTGLGTLTNANGRFVILNVPAGTYEVRAARIGYGAQTQEITAAAGETLTLEFAMRPEALGLDEIIVTGTAGAARRREIGNTINQINLDDMQGRPVSATQALQAAAPGIEVMSAGGELGQGSRIQLRGQNSLSMTNQPIIYIDGVRMMSGGFPTQGPPDRRAGRSANVTASPLDQLNPNDIERIEVIKGSAATTLYGTEASAGVIQIFTRSGSAGAPVWTVETQQGTGWNRKFGVDPAPYNFMEPFSRSGWLGLGDGDWGTLHNQQYSASVRGGGQDLQYFVSGQMQDQLGIMPQDSLTRYTVRGNFTFTPLAGLQLAWNTGYSNTWSRNTPSANNAQGLVLNVIRQERNYFGSNDPDLIEQIFVQDFQNTIERFTTGGTVTYAPTSNLTNRLTIGYDYNQQLQRHLRPFGFIMLPRGALHVHNWEKRLLTFDYVGNYSFNLMDNVRSNFSWGGQAVGDNETVVEAFGEDFPGAVAPTINSAAVNQGFETREKVWNAGFFFQNVFDVQDKYFLTLGARVDGNSAFGQDFGLQFYPKASVAWVVSDEGFWNPDWGQLRLRSAYGQSGRAPGAFDAVRTWNPLGYMGLPSFVPQNVGNPELGPEVSSEFEVGFEGSWMEGRVSADFTYFNQTTSDALLNVPQIGSLGFTASQARNLGKVGATGWELSLNTTPIQSANWGWDVGVNFGKNENEILDLGTVQPTPTLQVGRPIRPMIAWKVANPDEIAAPVYTEDGSDHFYGPTHPTTNISMNTSLRMPRGITLSALGEYRGGHYLYDEVFAIGRSVRSPLCYPYYQNPETSVALKDDVPAIWRARCTPAIARGYAWDATFFKLRNVSANFPVDFAFPDQVNNASLTLALDNSYLWRKEMPFMDPETLGNAGINTDASTGRSERIPAPIQLRISLRVMF
ncbi:MAG: hypothetical protein EA421_07160 [Gemmatimonadales bacterium]|nr:MAG: hypothetical protein EA421_07160 [Gemmatimonadales bacterium]